MIGLGVKLSLADKGDYWDDVERWLRNHFSELQLTDPAWIYRHTESLKPLPELHRWATTDRVIERNIGAFAGQATPTEWNVDIMHCCTGNATRAIHYAWEAILEFSDGKLKVNMLLNRASQWADIDSHIPFEGQVDVRVKQACDLSVRIPIWPHPHQVSHGPAVTGLPHLDQVRCTVSGSPRGLAFDGRYALVGPVRAGDSVVVTFPIWETAMSKVIAAQRYWLTMRGNTVVEIDSPGRMGPLYQRSHYRTSQTRWRRVHRFVAQRGFRW